MSEGITVTDVEVGYPAVVTPYGLMQNTFPSFVLSWWQLMPIAEFSDRIECIISIQVYEDLTAAESWDAYNVAAVW